MRLSDIKALTWDKIQGDKIHFRQEKTGGVEYVPLSTTAKDILLEMGDPKCEKVDKVFNLKSIQHRGDYLRAWAKSAGINKQLSYHSSRHTFATLLLTKGVDLYTVSKLLGHEDIKTTLIYAKIIDKVKDNAVDMLPVTKVVW